MSKFPGRGITRSAPAAAALALTLCASGAQAYTFHSYCDGVPDRHDRTSLAEFRMQCSFPDGTSLADRFASAIFNWNANSGYPVTGYDVATDCTFHLGNWHNEVGMADRSTIDNGWNAVTRFAHINACVTGGGGDYSEADSKLAADLDAWSQVPPSQGFSNVHMFKAMVHEMGHQLGLGDDFAHLNIMNSGAALFPGSPNGPTPYPDDVTGVSLLYGFNASNSLFAGGQHWEPSLGATGEVADNLPDAVLAPCVNTSLDAIVTVVNMGPQVTYSHQVWLARNPDGSSPVVSYTWAGVTTPRMDYSTFAFSLALAGITSGTYYLAHRVDSGDQVAESNEGDNLLVYAKPVVVTDCNNALTWFSSSRPEFL